MRKGTIKYRNFIKNISYSMISNLIAFAIAVVGILILPKFLGVENYGYFQLYNFYVSYVGFLHFGWADGVYLRYGGEYYENLNRPRFSGQFWGLFVFEIIICSIVFSNAILLSSSSSKAWVIGFTGIAAILILPRTLLQFILQCTNRIRDYAITIVVERAVYLIMILSFILAGVDSFIVMIVADIIGKVCALLLAIWYCHDIIRVRPEYIKYIVREAKLNIFVGIKLMISNICGLLFIGVVRYAIEYNWGVAIFGKVSLSLSVSNFLMVLINAVSLVMFPLLRRTDPNQYSRIYDIIRSGIMVTLLGLMITYYPIKTILSLWLPQYADSLVYMAILFPLCVFESKNSLLITTYLKTLRKEAWLLLVNSITMGLSLFLTWLTVFVMDNLDLTVLLILMLVAFRCVFAEIMVSRVLEIKVLFDIILEIIMVTSFVVCSWFVCGARGLIIYSLFFVAYALIKRQKVITLIRENHG